MKGQETHPEHLGVEELFRAHSPFIASFLRRLGMPASEVDDLVQDAWVVALQRDEPPTRAWLAGVLRNLARLRWRTRERREAREETAARTREVPSPEALTSQLETQRALAEALLRRNSVL